MGKASRAKQERREQRRERPHLEEKLAEQLNLLIDLGEMYDSGKHWAALPLAATLRLLLHDTRNSHALLGQLGELHNLEFCDTAHHRDPANLIRSHEGLVSMAVIGGTPGWWYVPVLTNNEDRPDYPFVSFNSWWDLMVLQDSIGHSWTRRSLVLDIANREGGAHVDPVQSEAIRAVQVENSMGWVVKDSRGDGTFENRPFSPSIRQIAWEVQLTLERRSALVRKE